MATFELTGPDGGTDGAFESGVLPRDLVATDDDVRERVLFLRR